VRALHVIDSLAPGGGAENRFVEELLGFGDLSGHAVVHLFERDDLAPRLREAGIPVRGLGLRAAHGGRTFPWAAVRLARVIRAERPDVVHTSLYHADLAGQLAAWATGVPVVSTFVKSGDVRLNALRTGGRGASRRARVLDATSAWVARRSGARFRAISTDAADTHVAAMRLDGSRVEVIPRGVALERSEATPDRARFGLPEDRRLVVNVARHEPMKGHVALLEAIAAVRERVPDVHLAIAGTEGTSTPAIRATVERLGLHDAVTLLGHRPDVAVLLASADAFAFTSSSEGLGSAVLEAMVAGLPAVAFDIPSVREVTDGGRLATLVPVGDVDALADGLVVALQAGRQPGSPAARWVRERFDGAQIGPRVERYLATVAAAGPASRRAGRSRRERGTLVISIDTELQWGGIHHGEFAAPCDPAAEREAIGRTLTALARHRISATWAVVGHLFLDRCGPEGGVKHPHVERPDYEWFPGDWFDVDPCTDLDRDPAWYGTDVVAAIRSCPTHQELASHSFAHMLADDPGRSAASFDADLLECQRVAADAGVALRSFVYPRNAIGHVDRLANAGFTSYRGRPRLTLSGPRWRQRIARRIDAVALTRTSAVRPRRDGDIWDIPGTFLFNPADRAHLRLWLWQAKRRMRQAARHGSLVHLWFHPQNISQDVDLAVEALDVVLAEGRRMIDAGRLENRTMAELAESLAAAGG
jgi:glycosyltransferase involved in cell wall biosynthesis